MKKAKIFFWLVIIGFLSLTVYQNQGLFLSPQDIGLKLFVVDEYKAEGIPNAIFFLAFFLIGLLISYFYSLSERFKARKVIKTLNASVESHLQEIASLKNELASLKGRGGAQDEKRDTPAEQHGPVDAA